MTLAKRLRKLFTRKDHWLLRETLSSLQGQVHELQEENENLKWAGKKLKEHNTLLLQSEDSTLKADLNEAINIIFDYQKTLNRASFPDPNIQRTNNLLNKWGLQSKEVNRMFKILLDGKDITRGREF